MISFGDHFDLLWAVVDNVGPGQTQKRLNVSFEEFLGKVMIIGGIKGVYSHGNDIIHTVGMNQRTDSKSISIMREEKRSAGGRCSLDLLPVQEFMLNGFQMKEGQVFLHESEHFHLTFVLRMVDDKQVNGVI